MRALGRLASCWWPDRGELDPGLIRPLTGDDYLGVVMPRRKKRRDSVCSQL